MDTNYWKMTEQEMLSDLIDEGEWEMPDDDLRERWEDTDW